MADEQQVERVLVVTAHPDDVDFGAAGTVATWTKAGIEVTYAIVTNGDAGGYDEAVSRVEMAALRQAEQRAAAAEVGVTDVRFLGFQDGRLESTLDLRKAISAEIRKVRPQRVLTQSPVRNFQRIQASHPDHLATGEATLCAVYPDARNPFAHPELLEQGLEAWIVDQVWMMGTPSPDTWVDVTDVYERKVAALQSHVSQMPGIEDLDGLLKKWLGFQAKAAGYAEGRLAEAFQVLQIT